MNTLGEKIQEFRKQAGLSQEKLAEAVGVSRQAVTKWESNNSAPSTDNLFQLAEIFNISLNELTGIDKEDSVPVKSPSSVNSNTCCVITLCVLAFYFIWGISTQTLSVGTAVSMTVIGVLVQLSTHIFLSNAIKNNNFSGIAGYNNNTKYNMPELKHQLLRIDQHLSITSTGFVVLLLISGFADFTLFFGQLSFARLFILLYIVEIIFSVAFISYSGIDRVFIDSIDRKKAKVAWVSVGTYLVFIVGLLIEVIMVFTLKNIKNNTRQALTAIGYFIPACLLATIALFLEQSNVKKADWITTKYRVKKSFIVLIGSSAILMILMPFML